MHSTNKSVKNAIGSIGFLRGALLVIFLYVFCFFILNSCYKFELKSGNNILSNDQILELQVTLSGRIFEHESLRLQIVPENKLINTEEQNYELIKESEGKYYLWKDLSKFKPGIYRATAYFYGYSKNPPLFRYNIFKINNYQKRSVLFLIKPD